jgi:CheY-like chemotaxis protein
MAGPPATIMLAIGPEKVALWRRILDGYELVFVLTHAEAMQRLAREQDLQLAIIGVHFDESRMFTLLSDIRAHPKHGNVPVLVVLAPGLFKFSAIAVEGIDRAVAALGASFLNLDHFADDATGEASIRRIVDTLVASSKIPEGVPREQR